MASTKKAEKGFKATGQRSNVAYSEENAKKLKGTYPPQPARLWETNGIHGPWPYWQR